MKKLKAWKVPGLALMTSLALASEALAHPMPGGSGLLAGLAHPLTGLDHLLAMIAVGLWAGQMGGKARWRVPTAFVALMLVGGFMAMAGVRLPFVESGIIASVVVLGLLIAAAIRWPPLASMALVGIFAIFHGHAHGSEIAAGASGATFAIGFAVTTASLHALGILLAALIAKTNRPVLLRLAGAAVACSALFLI